MGTKGCSLILSQFNSRLNSLHGRVDHVHSLSCSLHTNSVCAAPGPFESSWVSYKLLTHRISHSQGETGSLRQTHLNMPDSFFVVQHLAPTRVNFFVFEKCCFFCFSKKKKKKKKKK